MDEQKSRVGNQLSPDRRGAPAADRVAGMLDHIVDGDRIATRADVRRRKQAHVLSGRVLEMQRVGPRSA